MLFDQEDLAEIKNILELQSLEIFFNSQWGSQTHGFRSMLHRDLEIQSSKFQSLFSSSISHTQDLGGYIFTEQPNIHLGFDLELTERVKNKLVERISDLREVQGAPSAAHLWVAKEAAFKSLRKLNQPDILSEIKIGSWQNLTDKISTYRFAEETVFAKHTENLGLVLQKGQHSIAIFKIKQVL